MKDSAPRFFKKLFNLIILYGWASSGKEARKHELHLRVLRLKDFCIVFYCIAQRMCII